MATNEPIGRVSATIDEPSTTSSFLFWTDKDEKLFISDLVKVQGLEDSYTYGIVIDSCNISDAPNHMASYISYDFGNNKENDKDVKQDIQRTSFNCIRCRVLCNSKNINNPVTDGASVYKCTEKEIQSVLFNVPEDEVKRKDFIPFGYMKMYGDLPVGCMLPKSRILGPEAVHVNFSGVSGRAAKTTSTMCILSAIHKAFHDEVAFVLFNVKGDDLLYLYKEAEIPKDERNKQTQTEYEKCFTGYKNLFDPSTDLTYFLPEKLADAKGRTSQYFLYYTPFEKDHIDLIFASDDDSYGTTESFIKAACTADKLKNWDDLKKFIPEDTTGISDRTNKKCHRILNTVLNGSTIFRDYNNNEPDDLCKLHEALNGEHSINFEDNREYKSILKPGNISVIDVHSLSLHEQTYVIGRIIRCIREQKKANTKGLANQVILFADELNQFAPKSQGSRSAICEMLVDIAARGRTEGIILFTAEQFMSKVDDQIVDNCSVKIYGHTNSGELSDPKYAHIPVSIKNRICMLQNGYCIIDSADLPVPIEVQFPYPSYILPNDNLKKD